MASNQLKHDSSLLYQLYIQYIGTEGHGFNIVNKYSLTKNIYKFHRYFCVNYKKKYYLANKATEAEKNIKTLAYRGERTIFNIEEYYKIITEAFTYLEHYGPYHELNEHQKVLKFWW